MSIQSVRALSTSTYQSFSAYMTVRQQKVATVALLIVGCLVALFACYWHCFGTKKRKVRVNEGENDVENPNAQAPVNNKWQAQIDKMKKDQQEMANLAAENQQLQLNLQRMLNTPIQQLVPQPFIARLPAPIPQFVAPAPAFHAVPPQAAAAPAPRQNFPTLPELLAHVDAAINHLSDLEKSMNQRGVNTDQVGLAGIISNYNTQIKPTLVHPIDGANDAQRLKWKDLLETLKQAKRKLFSFIDEAEIIAHDQNMHEIQLMSNFSKVIDPLYTCLAEGYHLAGRYKEAVEIADKIANDREFKDKLFISSADYYCQQGQLKEAVEVLGKVWDDKAGKDKGYIKVAEAYCQKDELKEAVEVLGKVWDDKAGKDKGYIKIAEAHCQKNELKEAVEVLGKVWDDKAGKDKGYIKIAWAYYKKNQLKDAFNVLDKIWNDKKAKDECLMKIAEDCYKKGNRKEARDAIDKTGLDYSTKQALLKRYQ